MKYQYKTEAWCDCGDDDVEVEYHATLDDALEYLRLMTWEVQESNGIHTVHVTTYKEEGTQ
jgi:hypothetical protein